MTSFESTVVVTGRLPKGSRPEISKAVGVGEALGAIWQDCESSNNPFTLEWELKGSKWQIIAKYDPKRPRDGEAESTVYYHSSMNAPFAEVIILDSKGNRLEQLEE
jgi:hypothetical protein